MVRTVSNTKPDSRSAYSLPSHSFSPDSSDKPESWSKSTKDVPGWGRSRSNAERNHSSMGSLSSRFCSPHSSSNDSSDSNCSSNSRQRYSAKKRKAMEKFGSDEHKNSLERHDCKKREENNKIERKEYNTDSLNVKFDMIIT